MRALIVLPVAIALTGCVTGPDTQAILPVEIVQGKVVQIWGVSGVRTPDGAKITGHAKRRLAPNGAVNEHLHAEALAENGSLLESRNVKWNTPASVRVKASTSFQTTFASMPAGELSRVRLRIVEGPVHAVDE